MLLGCCCVTSRLMLQLISGYSIFYFFISDGDTEDEEAHVKMKRNTSSWWALKEKSTWCFVYLFIFIYLFGFISQRSSCRLCQTVWLATAENAKCKKHLSQWRNLIAREDLLLESDSISILQCFIWLFMCRELQSCLDFYLMCCCGSGFITFNKSSKKDS